MHFSLRRTLSAARPGSLVVAGAGVAAVGLACVLVGVGVSWLLGSRSVEAQDWWLSEQGAIETTTAALHLSVTTALVAIALFGRRIRGAERIPRPWLLATCATLLTLRELDCHKRWSTRDIFKTRFYVDPAIDTLEKLVAGLAVAAIVGALISAAVVCGPRLVRRLRERSAAATLATTGVLLLGVGKGLDMGVRLWQTHVFALAPQDERYVGFVEEIGEAFAPLCLFAALGIVGWAAKRTNLAAGHEPIRFPSFRFDRVLATQFSRAA